MAGIMSRADLVMLSMRLSTCLTWAIDYGVGICDNAKPYLERTWRRSAYVSAAAMNKAVI